MNISVTFKIDVDIEGWAKVSNISVEEATTDVLEFFGRMDPVHGQTYATLTGASAVEEF
jgi:hypothetical protein